MPQSSAQSSMNRKEIKSHYRAKKDEIQSRLDEFKQLQNSSEARIFRELVFVLLTSQTEAKKAWKAAKELEKTDYLLKGSEENIAQVLRENEIQYEENKSQYIVENREKLSQPTLTNPEKELKLKDRINPDNLQKTREELVEDLKGIGYKGASHFLRNIGYGDKFAILSGHTITSMNELGITVERPSNREEYLETEQKFRELSEDLDIPVPELDLLLWSIKTGEVFR